MKFDYSTIWTTHSYVRWMEIMSEWLEEKKNRLLAIYWRSECLLIHEWNRRTNSQFAIDFSSFRCHWFGCSMGNNEDFMRLPTSPHSDFSFVINYSSLHHYDDGYVEVFVSPTPPKTQLQSLFLRMNETTSSHYAYVLEWRLSCNYPFKLLLIRDQVLSK